MTKSQLAIAAIVFSSLALACRSGPNHARDGNEGGDGVDAGRSDSGIARPDAGARDGGEDASMLPVVPSMGCGRPFAPGETNEEITVGGVTRTYVLTVPPSYDPNRAMPLVFGWHGSGTRGAEAILPIGVVDDARGAAIFVHADALPDANGLLRWNLHPDGPDVALYDALYAHVTSTLCIDEARVFSYGFSLGGYMSNLIGCLRAETHTAIAPFHGGLADGLPCSGGVAAFISNRQNDQLVAISEGIRARDHWTSADGCDVSRSTPIDPSPCVEYQGCAELRPVVWCLEEQGGHTPPPSYLGRATWTFFSRFLR